jgi:hypothetical protein
MNEQWLERLPKNERSEINPSFNFINNFVDNIGELTPEEIWERVANTINTFEQMWINWEDVMYVLSQTIWKIEELQKIYKKWLNWITTEFAANNSDYYPNELLKNAKKEVRDFEDNVA